MWLSGSRVIPQSQRSLVSPPVRACALVAGQVPRWRCERGNQLFLSQAILEWGPGRAADEHPGDSEGREEIGLACPLGLLGQGWRWRAEETFSGREHLSVLWHITSPHPTPVVCLNVSLNP